MKWYIGLYETSGVMAQEWARHGHPAVCVDLQNEPGERDGVQYVRADVLSYLPPREAILDGVALTAIWTPCTDMAVSGARWFTEKGLQGLGTGLLLADRGVQLAEWLGGPWLLEQPVSTLSSYWRKPDHYFHPWQYCGLEPADNYTKKTCLWTGNDFVMPPPNHPAVMEKPDDRIHKAAPGPERANFRSASPRGFCRATVQANSPQRVAT